ncbi:hypothetical protein ACOWPH_19685 [Anabaena sp. PCC 7938]|uniref:hypothetical protein n=1 Tax=Anabaena sp. PCC 7938 TaxID=1296340 RepID=UPI0002F96EA9|nr:hypothetical protein [Anabaena sp. CCAP 1446/1C]MCM2408505.1 hypothetical protein [Anabaena sp. CCAP 1446/1C]
MNSGQGEALTVLSQASSYHPDGSKFRPLLCKTCGEKIYISGRNTYFHVQIYTNV